MNYAMSPPPPPLLSPPMSQADSSQKLPRLDSAERPLTNGQRLVAIELQREKVQDLEQTRRSANQ